MEAALAHLGRIPLLACLNPTERRSLAPSCRIQVVEKGAVVFHEGDRALDFSFVAVGFVKVLKSTPTRSVIVRIIRAGGPIGIVAPWEARPYPGTAVALVPSTILHVPEREFFQLSDRHPEMVRQILRVMMDRQVLLGQRLCELTGPVEGRIATVLLDLVDAAGPARPEPALLEVPLSRQDLADLAGTTVETAIRVMSRWGKDGLVKTRDDGFEIPDVAALRALAES